MATAKVSINNRVVMDITDTTATADKIATGYTAYGADGVKMTGTYSPATSNDFVVTFTQNQNEEWEPDCTYAEVYDAYIGGKNIVSLASGEYVASYIKPESAGVVFLCAIYNGFSDSSGDGTELRGYSWSASGYQSADVSRYYNTMDADATPSNVLSGFYFFNADGAQEGTIEIKSASDLSASGATVTVPAGYYASQATKSIASGTTTAPTSISETSASVSTGTNTLTLSKTVSVTPRVTTAGYISSGTAGNSSVSLTASVTTKARATITPSTSNQTIASGTYLTGTQTIAGDSDLTAANIKTGVSIFNVTGTYTSDATAASADILRGETAYVNGSKVTGTLDIITYYTGTSEPSSSQGSNGDIYLKVAS